MKERKPVPAANSDTRPWGMWEEYLNEPGYRVKRIIVDPGKRLSLQKHEQRSEYWVVVHGSGTMTVGQRTWDVSTGDTILIPKEAFHRVENTGAVPLVVIETQVGVCLEEDIVRSQDDWGRT
jgi:mannose-6-phosphate isomerase-like protein (cupin superfamily)